VDITEGIPKQLTLLWCKECGRYLQPPKHWIRAELESKELLTYCLKRTKGLQKVKLVDAGFIWTEPHSRRLKVKVTIQAEVFNGAILQQSFVVEYIVETHMCPDCSRAAANPNTWTACVQVRQHTEHKRTFMYLEQLILRHNAASHCLSIKDIHEGIDFYFAKRSHAIKFVDFLNSVVPIRYRHDKQLVSHNEQNATYNYKYTFSVEIVPICKDDLICLPAKVSGPMGNIGPMVLCTRVMNTLHLTDPTSLRTVQVDAPSYWRQPYRAMLTSRALTEYVVLDIEPIPGAQDRRYQLAEASVARTADFGTNDQVYTVRTHLGNLLHPGDTAMGYDLTRANLVDDELDKYTHSKGYQLPEIVLVRKSYDERRKARKAKGQQRAWKLKRMAVDEDNVVLKVSGNRRQNTANVRQQEMERFMQDLEEDPEMRSKIALYRDPNYKAQKASSNAMTDDDESVPEVPLEELLDEMHAMQLDEGQTGADSEDESLAAASDMQ
jgi:nonsense-mediated mRNA decay protein 3